MKLTLMKKGLLGILRRLLEKLDRRLLDVAVEERDADDAIGYVTPWSVTLLPGLSTYWPLILKSSFAFSPALPESDPLVTLLNMARSSGSMSGNQVGSA